MEGLLVGVLAASHDFSGGIFAVFCKDVAV